MLLYVVEHYKITTPSPTVAEAREPHMATHALMEKKEDQEISKGTFLGMFFPVIGTVMMLTFSKLMNG